MTTSPTLREFLAEAKIQFRFLEDEFGFSAIPNASNDNLFLTKYYKHPVQVGIEGVTWGFGVQVMLLNLAGSDDEVSRIPLWVVAKLRGANHDDDVSDQLQQLAIASNVLRWCASDILKGDTSIFPEAHKLMMEIHSQDETTRRKLP